MLEIYLNKPSKEVLLDHKTQYVGEAFPLTSGQWSPDSY